MYSLPFCICSMEYSESILLEYLTKAEETHKHYWEIPLQKCTNQSAYSSTLCNNSTPEYSNYPPKVEGLYGEWHRYTVDFFQQWELIHSWCLSDSHNKGWAQARHQWSHMGRLHLQKSQTQIKVVNNARSQYSGYLSGN